MFTGIVQHRGIVSAVDTQPAGRRLCIDGRGWLHQPAAGESISVNGVCLTIADAGRGEDLVFDVIHQTLRVTTLGGLVVGGAVNLEHAVTPTTMLSGHIVQGHVDTTADVIRCERAGGEVRLRVGIDSSWMTTVVDKGSITIDGVSLTVAAVGADWFEVALIPTTLSLTTLGDRSVGDRVNIETDYIAKAVANWMQRTQSSG